MEEIKVLIVDDEELVLRSLRRLLMDENYTILTATSGEEGLEILQREEPQIIISDYRMPDMNGVDFLRKAYLRIPDSVRIIISGYADISAIIGAINEGRIYKFIPKPWNDEELKATLSNAIDRYLLAKRNRELMDELLYKNEKLQELLREKSELLEFKSRVLKNFQNILNAIPIGIMGVDFDFVMVQCNDAWISLVGIEWSKLGENIYSFLPEDICNFVVKIRDTLCSSYTEMVINNTRGKIIGTVFNDETSNQKGIIIIFLPYD